MKKYKFKKIVMAQIPYSHVKPEDIKVLKNKGSGVSSDGEYTTVWCIPPSCNPNGNDFKTTITLAGYSKEFFQLAKLIALQGFTHIRFDSDEDVVPGLPVYPEQ